MNAALRFNDVLLIAGRAFQPFQCVAWTPADGTGIVNLSVVDRANTTLIDRTQLTTNIYSDPQKLALALKKTRDELERKGFVLTPWSMPELRQLHAG